MSSEEAESSSTERKFHVTAEDFRAVNWQDAIAEHPKRECWSYCDALGGHATRCQEADDERGERVYAFLHVITSFHANYDAQGNPYGPRWRNGDGSRALMAEDLADSDLLALKEMLEEIKDAEMRARAADVLWSTKKDHIAARIAVAAFLEAAETHKTADLWPPYLERLERAAQISASIAFGQELHQGVLKVIERAVEEFREDSSSGLLCERLMSLALQHKGGDVLAYAQLAESIGERFIAASDFNFSQRYWQLAARCHRLNKNAAESRRCQIAEAEVLVLRADAGINGNPDAAYAAHWLGVALQKFRQAKAAQSRIKEIHLRMLELQKEATRATRPIDFDVEGVPGYTEAREKCQKAVEDLVRGEDVTTAIELMARLSRPSNIEEIEKMVEKNKDEFIWTKIVTEVALDAGGKSAEFIHPNFKTEDERVKRQRMVQHANRFTWQNAVIWRIEPARLVISAEHTVRLRDLYHIVLDNPFVVPGHEGLYLHGLQAGFFGDWPVAMHLLIPQLEASIRHVLQMKGVVTSTMEADQTQKEKDINALLWMEETEGFLGKEITFDLQGILIERFGSNMRNESAHGLMAEGAFYQANSVYLWWLTLHILWRGYRLRLQVEKEVSDA